MGLACLRDLLDGDMLERAHRCLLPPWARTYWQNREKGEPPGGTQAEEAGRRARQAGIAHDVMHALRMELAQEKSIVDGSSPFTGVGTPGPFGGRRAGIIDIRLGERGWALKKRAQDGNEVGVWRLMPREEAECVSEHTDHLGILGLSQLVTRDGG
jgi:hypothetical protein